MPDILDMQKAVGEAILGARVSYDTYTWMTDVDFVACPRVTIGVERDEQLHQCYIAFHPDAWREFVTPEFIVKWALLELEQVL